MAAQLKAFGLGSPATALGALPKGAPFTASPATAAPSSSAPAQLRRELKGAALASRKALIGNGAEASRPAAAHVTKALPTPGAGSSGSPASRMQAEAVATGSETAVSAPSGAASTVIHLFRRPFLSAAAAVSLLKTAQEKVSASIVDLNTEQCYNVEVEGGELSAEEYGILTWLLQETYEPEGLAKDAFLDNTAASPVVEVGPRLSFSTAWSTNAVSICRSCKLPQITRIERSRRYQLVLAPGAQPLTPEQLKSFAALVHDRMTECIYDSRLTSFSLNTLPEPVRRIPVVKEGRAALERVNKEMGLAFDEWDLDYYTQLFRDDMGRDPTDVELFDIAQSNSEHSRHWFFNGILTVDGEKVPHTLFGLVRDTLKANPGNSVIAFKDNSSAIRGQTVHPLMPSKPGQPCPVEPTTRDLDVLFTAETHNFPCAVAPFPGAETGAGGRIRDTHATGTGSLIVAATAGYCVGNLQMEGHTAPWEDPAFIYPPNLAPPLQILVDSSDGASDYGNKFGEPLIQGYTRTFGMRLPNGERREWLKPIMFSAGIGQIDHNHLDKAEADLGMLVVKIGGPAYRIGMGGGAASSMVSGTRDAELDFNAVQRGDAEMSQKLYRVVRTCVEMGESNPIVAIHDQGAGGNCNVVKEIIYPQGAEIDVRSIVVGDETMSVLEIWGAEYQEQDAILIKPESEAVLRQICERERLPMAVIGTISGGGKVVLYDGREREEAAAKGLPVPPPAVDLDLEKVLGDMPRKSFDFVRGQDKLEALDLPPGLTVADTLSRVLRLPSVASKRFLTNKVDRCVTGLIAQQQTVGPLQITLADVAVIAQTHTGTTGAACSIGEQPIKGLLNPAAMARLAVGEALTNLVWAKVTALEDVKASGNWMYAAKMGGEGAAMYDAALALKECMIELGIAIDGGKDSLSMAAQAGGETVMAPGNIVISTYVTCPDITLTVTPDFKAPGSSVLIHIDFSKDGKRRLGGSALAQVYDQLGNECPDVDVGALKRGFNAVQDMIGARTILAGHDISDGGLLTAALEMAFAGNCGLSLALPGGLSKEDPLASLYAEELGLLIEVSTENEASVLAKLQAAGVPAAVVGRPREGDAVEVSVGGEAVLEGSMVDLRDAWEETSFLLERVQRLEKCAASEQATLRTRTEPSWNLPFTPEFTSDELMARTDKPKVAILREEGSNGDREMAAAVYAAGMEAWDVSMSDLLSGKVTLDQFRGIVFVGGFSYADVLDSAKGWAATIRFNPSVWTQFQDFYARKDTFSLGVCNGCQLMALLGWVPGPDVGGTLGAGGDEAQPRFVHNESGRFECRFSTVEIQKSPSVMLKDMEGTRVGIWVAHGEGRALFPDGAIHEKIVSDGLAPLRYTDDAGNATEVYPFNPNGSPAGIAALCSEDGRHLAMMPHPERCYLMWQFPWAPKSLSSLDPAGPSPWMKMFQNARVWCDGN